MQRARQKKIEKKKKKKKNTKKEEEAIISIHTILHMMKSKNTKRNKNET